VTKGVFTIKRGEPRVIPGTTVEVRYNGPEPEATVRLDKSNAIFLPPAAPDNYDWIVTTGDAPVFREGQEVDSDRIADFSLVDGVWLPEPN